MEIKCPEQFKDIDPKNICHISKNPSVVLDGGKLRINRDHSYYKQIQMQLALTTQTWCDFILYTSKGLIIDRVPFDKQYWSRLHAHVMGFYFDYMLDEIIKK